MYEATITVKQDVQGIYELFMAEEQELGRASYTIDHSKDKLTFHITAPDATALKVALNTINKILLVWEKTRTITKK